jgi:hypothetical protein
MLQAGDIEATERDIGTIFLIGSALQQNPSLIGQMVGVAIHRIGLRVIAMHVPPQVMGNRFLSLLPDAQSQFDGMHMAWGSEWLAWQGVFKILEKQERPPSRSVYYNENHTRWLMTRGYLDGLSHLESWKLGAAFAQPSSLHCDFGQHAVEWIINPIGRNLACVSVVNWPAYNSRMGQAMDMVEATRVVIAARRFYHAQKRWPTQEAELVPAYLKIWPTSALDGQPLRWLDDRSGVALLDLDGKTICKTDACRVPFNTPQPLEPKMGVADSAAHQVLPSLPK